MQNNRSVYKSFDIMIIIIIVKPRFDLYLLYLLHSAVYNNMITQIKRYHGRQKLLKMLKFIIIM